MSLTHEVRRAYDDAGPLWDAGPARVYGALARPVLHALGDVRGSRALDLGTGSGVLADLLVGRGAWVVGLDLSFGMLARHARRRPPGVVGDVSRLPVRDAAFDVVTASFVLNHLRDPVPALREAARALAPGGRLVATSFEGEAAHPAKQVVDEVARAFGFRQPGWYLDLKAEVTPVLSTSGRVATAAAAAGLTGAEVQRIPVVVTLTPPELVGWRTGMAHLASFVASLPAQQRLDLVRTAEQALAEVDQPLELVVLLLSAGV